MKVLVTGGLGFIGSELVKQLLSQGHTVHNIDAMTYAANLNNLNGYACSPLYSAHFFNLVNVEKIDELFEEHSFDVVFHLAAHSHVDNSISGPKLFMENVNGTFNLLDSWRRIVVDKCGWKSRFVYMSTDEVMGDLPLQGNEKFTTQSPINPSSPYSASKAAAEVMCRSYRRTYSLPITCIRSSNAYGPRQHPEKLIPKTILNCLNNHKIPVYGSGANVRDWIFVEDLAGAIVTIGSGLLDPDGRPIMDVVNVGSDNAIANIHLVSKLIDLTGSNGDLVEFVKDRLGHDLKYAIDTRETEKLGWKATTSLRDGLLKTIDWYKNNKEWCNGID